MHKGNHLQQRNKICEGNKIKYVYSCQFDVTDKQGAETKRLEKFLVVVRQMRHEGLKSLTTNSNKITRVVITCSKIVTACVVETALSNPYESSPDEPIPPNAFDNSSEI